jgi:predicted nucleotidyltransferase
MTFANHAVTLEHLKTLIQAQEGLEFAVLVGSQANGTANAQSDWDLALRWHKDISAMDQLMLSEQLKQTIHRELGVHPDQLDLIDMAHAKLAMRALVAEEGVVLAGQDTLPWLNFLTLTWAELEDFHWRKTHAA